MHCHGTETKVETESGGSAIPGTKQTCGSERHLCFLPENFTINKNVANVIW